MSALLWILPPVVALCGVGAVLGRLPGPRGTALTALGACALALAGAILAPPTLHLNWLMLGATFGVDGTGRALLAAAALVWGAATLHAFPLRPDGERHLGRGGARFAVCFLLTLLGNLAAITALDLTTFYLSFAVMTFAAYGLVVHEGTPEAVRAGRIYLVLAIAGEVLLLAGFFPLVGEAGNLAGAEVAAVYAVLAHPEWVGGLIAAGFAVKMGVMPLHVWLALAHPAAPVPASAVLSGVIVKAGLLGWLRFLPDGAPALGGPGITLAVLGLGTAFVAALIGCFQQRAKTVLAYSTISQMGLISLAAGLLIAGRLPAEAALGAIGLLAVHHALVKGALFLAVDRLKQAAREGWTLWVGGIVVVLALSLVGAPVGAGLVAKGALKQAVGDPLAWAVTGTSVTTALVLVRFLICVWPVGEEHAGAPGRAYWTAPATVGWLVLVAASQTLPWWLAPVQVRGYALQLASLFEGLWPLALAAIGTAAAAAWARRRGGWPQLPEGDILRGWEGAVRWVRAWRVRGSWRPVSGPEVGPETGAAVKDRLTRLQQGVLVVLPRREPPIATAGVAMLVILLVLAGWFAGAL